jgi:hypothetical protein
MKNLQNLIKQDLAGNKPKWCKHITFWSRAAGEEETFLGINSFPQAGGWSFKTPDAPCGVTADNWKFCPICGTPRAS